MKRNATAVWKGTGKEGSGTLSAPSGVLKETPYSFKARFENEDGTAGTNPEEMIAAAHAGCFTMALSFAIANEGFEADHLETKAVVKMTKDDKGFKLANITLDLKGKVSGMDEEKFTKLAEGAKENCPISRALEVVPIELKVSFEE